MRCTEYFRDREPKEARDEEARADVENGNTPHRDPYREEANEVFLSLYADRVMETHADNTPNEEDGDDSEEIYKVGSATIRNKIEADPSEKRRPRRRIYA